MRAARSYLLRTAARKALPTRDRRLGGGHQGFEREGHRRTSPAGLDELGELSPLAFVQAAARLRRPPAAAYPDRGFLEVIQPCAAAAGRGVQRLLLVAGI